jgi:hypothetical protein
MRLGGVRPCPRPKPPLSWKRATAADADIVIVVLGGEGCFGCGAPQSDRLTGKTAIGVRRDKAALSSGCKTHPAIRSSRKQSEQSWR